MEKTETQKKRKHRRRYRWRMLHRDQWRAEKRAYARRRYERLCREQGKEPVPYHPNKGIGTLNVQKTTRKTLTISQEDIDDLFAAQHGRCAICTTALKPRQEAGRTKFRAHLDHCHTTGRVRGILCSRCNVGIGHFKDNPWTLKRVIAYLADPPAWEPRQAP